MMADTLYIELVEKMLSDPELKTKVNENTITKLKTLLIASKLPKATDLGAVLGEDKP